MRYIIGARIPNNDGEIIEGLYVVNKYGLPWILNDKKILLDDKNKNGDDRILVFESIEDIDAYLAYLRDAYRSEFLSRAARYNLNIRDFRFYPIKFNSSKMKHIKLLEKRYTKDKKHKLYKFVISKMYC